MKHKFSRARFRLDELTFGTFNVRAAADSGVKGIDHIDTILRPCAAKVSGVIDLHDTKWDVSRYDSITVSSTWELTSVSMRYSQGGGVSTSLSRLMYCTHD